MENCEVCKANPGYVCHGDFYTTGEYAAIIKDYDIHGVNLNQKIDSVKPLLDLDTILLLKVLICDSNRFDYPTSMTIMFLLDEIISKLSNDNNESIIPTIQNGSDKDV
jgi:hypothetical protein